MNKMDREGPDRLAADLLDRVRPLLSGKDTAGFRQRGPGVFSYCALMAERVAAARLEHPIVAILAQGSKEIWIGDCQRRLTAGDVFVLPGGVDLDVVNIPDPRLGLYESILIEVRPGLVAPRPRRTRAGFEVRVPLNRALVETISHAALDLIESPRADHLAELRLRELLLLLSDEPAAQPLFEATIADRLRWLVLTAPDHDWSGPELARRLGCGASTLRRRLAEEGTTLRRLVRETRMAVARDLLENRASVAEAALAVGYASRSHFARGFREVFGMAPREGRTPAEQTP